MGRTYASSVTAQKTMNNNDFRSGRISADASDEIYVTYDGQSGYPLHAGDIVRIRRAERALQLVKAPGRNYFELLREKLKWGERGGRQ